MFNRVRHIDYYFWSWLFSHSIIRISDAAISNEINLWRKQFDQLGRQVITTSEIVLDASKRKYAECTMCDVIADAFLDSYHKMNDVKTTAIAFVQAGGVRVTLPKGRKHFVLIFFREF